MDLMIRLFLESLPSSMTLKVKRVIPKLILRFPKRLKRSRRKLQRSLKLNTFETSVLWFQLLTVRLNSLKPLVSLKSGLIRTSIEIWSSIQISLVLIFQSRWELWLQVVLKARSFSSTHMPEKFRRTGFKLIKVRY